MGYYIIKRIVFVTLVLFVLTTVTFFLSAVAPADPARLWVGPHPAAGQVEAAQKLLGLDKPIHIRYIHYLGRLLNGDFGDSIRTRQPVSKELKRYFTATIELVTVSTVISLIIAVPIGVYTAFRREKLEDQLGRIFSFCGVAIPIFWLGMMLQLLSGSIIEDLPIQGRLSSTLFYTNPLERVTGFFLIDSILTGNWVVFRSSLAHIVLPSVTMAFASLAYIVRQTRSSMIEVMNENYIRTARAFGISERQIRYKYAFKNGLIPVVTVVGIVYAMNIGGSILVESIFDWPGLGRQIWFAILNNDFPVIIGITIVFAVICCTVNLIVDLLYSVIDPRVKTAGKNIE
ncbi:ABC transporter permease [bacterium]|nr:ABC transporter permease [bacterium]